VAIDADLVASALAGMWQHLASALPGAWAVRDGGSIALFSGVSIPTLNGVWTERADADPAAAAGLLDRVGATGLPYCLQLRPGAHQALRQLAVGRSMSLADDGPLMVLEDPGELMRSRQPTGLKLRQLSQDEAFLHADVAAAGFEAPEQLLQQLITADVLHLPGVRCYVGEVDGQAVTTGMGVTLGGSVGVFSIATPPAYRRHGYGAAITGRAVADGLAAGAKWSWLQSTPIGYPTYYRLGFRTVETWPCWVSGGSANPAG
jgi:N-acetylglutamate synthase